ncbi:glutamate-5-semialdehyde dehydrogenase [Pseudonocardia eucalypti]|uniref:Gamma-glutamyl phosphate reductase n=1 Tax=Pseudonocardia eucalypti TaxID=648755 RepID=A0ABP9PMU3_9PSEU
MGPPGWTPRLQAKAYGEVHEAGERARQVSVQLRGLDRAARDKALLVLADALTGRREEILEANRADLARAPEDENLLRELTLDGRRIDDLAYEMRTLAALPDPLGEVVHGMRQRSGLRRAQVRAPIGVIAVLHEGMPWVLPHAAGMLLKTGNAVLLHDAKGFAAATDEALARIIRDALNTGAVPPDAVQLIPSTHKAAVRYLLGAEEHVDLVIPLLPRGIPAQMLPEARVPILRLGRGGGHIYVDAEADVELAQQIVCDSKIGYASFPHTATTVLVHAEIARKLVPGLHQALLDNGVAIHADERFAALAPGCPPATEDDWRADGPSAVLAAAVVDTLGDALTHIDTYGTGHTETVVTGDPAVVRRFTTQVDAATITVNAPITLTDPSSNPLDPALAYSTQRLRPRGPLGLQELTSTKWLVWASGQGFDLD